MLRVLPCCLGWLLAGNAGCLLIVTALLSGSLFPLRIAQTVLHQDSVIMSEVELLRRNDPARTCITIDLIYHERSAAVLAQALEQNPFVTDIEFIVEKEQQNIPFFTSIRSDLERVQRTDWNSLLRVIATRANLEKVALQGDVALRGADSTGIRNAPLARAILQAIQQNTAIRRVEL